ncbi:MAG: type II toxin-antitoxin system PemK/MazF family toxin [Kineosporiaceae bacterium]
MTALLTRGRVVWFQLGDADRKPAVVVSNDHRNRALDSALTARITSSPKPPLPSIVPLSAADPVSGRVLCDDLLEVYSDEVLDDGGALSLPTMLLVDDGLRHALGLHG